MVSSWQAMCRLCFRSTCNAWVAAPLILALLASVPFADGVLLHDHGDQGIHTHTVTRDDLCEGDLRAKWHRHHDDIPDDDHDDRNNDSGGREYAESLFIFVSDPALATGIHNSSSSVIPSNRHLSSRVLPRSMLPSDPYDAFRFMAAPWPSAQPLRPAFALDALLQTSRALLL